MAEGELPENIRKFIFEFIDSVEVLDVLLLLSSDRAKHWNANTVSSELRSSSKSAQSRLAYLQRIGLVDESSTREYHYAPQSTDLETVVTELTAIYATKKHRVLELIFTPLKQARALADAFRVSSPNPNEEENNG